MKSKNLVLAVLLSSMILALPACTSTDSSSSETSSSVADSSSSNAEESVAEETEAETEAAEYAFAIKSVSLSKDYDDSDVLVIEYDFTNNSDKATSFSFACQDTVYQDGVECDSTVVSCDDIDTQEQLNDIQSGKTYTLKVGYHIKDTSKPVDVVVTDLMGKDKFLEQTIEPDEFK